MSQEGHLRYRVSGVSDPIAVSVPVNTLQRWRRAARRWLTWGCSAFLLAIVGLWIALKVAPVTWWPIALFVYCPRWVLAGPLVVLVPGALWLRWRLLGALIPAA